MDAVRSAAITAIARIAIDVDEELFPSSTELFVREQRRHIRCQVSVDSHPVGDAVADSGVEPPNAALGAVNADEAIAKHRAGGGNVADDNELVCCGEPDAFTRRHKAKALHVVADRHALEAHAQRKRGARRHG